MKSKILHENPPLDFNPKISVVLAFIECEGKLLLLLNHPNKAQGLKWTVPGGKIEKQESPMQAIIREVWEETGIQLNQNGPSFCGKFFARNSRIDFHLQIYKVFISPMPLVKLNAEEHIEFQWMEPRDVIHLSLMEGADECLQFVYPDLF